MKKKLYTTFKLSTALLMFLFLGLLSKSNLIAQNNDSYFYAKYDNNSTLYFQWYSNSKIDENSTFIIWYSPEAKEEFSSDAFIELCKVSYSEALTSEGNFFYSYKFYIDPSTNHSFCLQILSPNGQSEYSKVFIMDQIIIEPPQLIVFTYTPSEVGTLNKEYISKVQAVYLEDTSKIIYYKLEQGPEGMVVNKLSGEIRWTPNTNNYTKVWIRAYLANDENTFCDYTYVMYIKSCEVPGEISGIITNKFDEPITNGYVVLFSADGENPEKPYEKNISELVDGKYSIEMDAGTYFMYFYDVTGQYFAYENANSMTNLTPITVKCNESITVNWKIENYSTRTFTVTGKVLDLNGNPKPYWQVMFQSIGENNVDGWAVYSASTDESGNYSITLPDGYSYYAYIYLDMMMENKFATNMLYYNQTFDRTKATLITLNDNISGIDFKIIENPDFKYYVVSGNVADENNKPLQGILVAFEGFNDSNENSPYYKFYDNVYTDENGNYSIKLPNLFKFVAYAANVTTSNFYGDYRPLFYKQTYNRDKATIISLTSNISGINFVFEPYESEYKNFISGIVVDTNDIPIANSFVELINLKADGSPDGFYQYLYGYTDDNGQFIIKGINPGSYILFASTQHSKEFLCGYYVENDIASVNYDKATKLEIGENSEIKNITITLPKFASKNSGGGIIKGCIYNNSNYSDENKAASAINSAKIYVKENYNALASFEESNADGSFMITGLASGKYNFVIDKRGFQLYEREVEVSESDITDLGLIKLIPLGNGITDDSSLMKTSLYPNPTPNKINLNFFTTSTEVNLKFYNLTGTVVKNLNVCTEQGFNSISLDLDDLLNGHYLLIISDGKIQSSISLIIQK